MSTIKSSYNTQGVSITCSIASLANNGARASTAVDNTSNLYLDALVFVKVKSGASGTVASGHVDIYAYGTVDGGTTYTEGVSGTDGGVTLTSPPNVRLIGIINVVANATTYNGGPFSVSAAFGGILPQKWGIIIVNSCGGALDTTEGNHSKAYQGVWNQVI